MASAHRDVLGLSVPRLRSALFLAVHFRLSDADSPPEVFPVLSVVLFSFVVPYLWVVDHASYVHIANYNLAF